MSDCDQSGRHGFCMHHCQDAFDALDALKRRYPEETDIIARLGFYPDSLLGAVGTIIHDVQANASDLGISIDEAAQTLFIDGLLMGVLLAARAPANHAAPALAEVSP